MSNTTPHTPRLDATKNLTCKYAAHEPYEIQMAHGTPMLQIIEASPSTISCECVKRRWGLRGVMAAACWGGELRTR